MRRSIAVIAHCQAKAARRWTIAVALCMSVLLEIGLTSAVRGDSPTTKAADATTQPNLSVAELRTKARQLISETRYDEALTVIDRILAKDPTNDYAIGVRPLVEDKALLARASTQPAVAATSPAAGGKENEKAFALLQKRIPELRFDAIGFSDVVDFLRDITGATSS
jgi:hypothetical protein